MIFKNCTFFNENFEKEFGDIEVENGIIKQIGIIDGDGKDMAGTILIPRVLWMYIFTDVPAVTRQTLTKQALKKWQMNLQSTV